MKRVWFRMSKSEDVTPERVPRAHRARLIALARVLPLALLLASCTATRTPTSAGARADMFRFEDGEMDQALSRSSPSEPWQVADFAGAHLEGFTDAYAYSPGEDISFAISCTARRFTARIFRLGWYGGADASQVLSIGARVCEPGAAPIVHPDTGLIEAPWRVNFRVHIGKAWKPGEYLTLLQDRYGYQSYVPFLIRSHGSSPILFIRNVTTDEAYNTWGGSSLYKGKTASYSNGRAVKVSFERPFATGYGSGEIITTELSLVSFLDRARYPVDFLTDYDVARHPDWLLHYKVIITGGHGEYWAGAQRQAFDSAIAHGVNVIFAGADQGDWQTRYESSPMTHHAYRVMTVYRYTSEDPVKGTEASVRFDDLHGPNHPESLLEGSSYASVVHAVFPWVVQLPIDGSLDWIFAGTSLRSGASLPGLVEREYDRLGGYDQRHLAPIGTRIFAASPVTNMYGDAQTADSTYYRALSGAQIVNLGSIGWSYGLDNGAGLLPSYVSPDAQRIFRNLVDRFAGVQPRL